LITVGLYAQSAPTEHPGVKLYLEGKYDEAAKTLSLAVKDKYWKSDASLWNYLGLAYIGANDYKKAKKAAQTAVDLAPQNSIYHTNLSYLFLVTRAFEKSLKESNLAISLDPKNHHAIYMRGSANFLQGQLDDAEKDADQMIALEPTDPRGYVLKSSISMSRLERVLATDAKPAMRDHIDYLERARNTLLLGAERAKAHPNRKIIDDELETVGAFYDHVKKEPNPTGATAPNIVPLKITYKPKASYTDKARYENVQGKIRVAILLGADGKVKFVLFLSHLGAGLDQEVLRAARQIKFEPKKVDGQPVSSIAIFEYGFNIY
jgi:TonB family protein